MSNLKEKFKGLSDLELRDIVTIKSDEYTEDALKIALEILESRGLSDFTESAVEDNAEISTIYDCLIKTDFEIIREKLSKLFLENEENLEKYKDVYADLLKMKPLASEETVYAFIGQTSDNFASRYPFDIFGVEEGSEEFFGLELYPWKEWLAFKIIDRTKGFIERAGIDEFIAICLHKMTAFGFSEDEIQNAFNNSFEEY